MTQRFQADGCVVHDGDGASQAISIRTSPSCGLEQTHDFRVRLRPWVPPRQMLLGDRGETVACKERRQLLRMGHPEAAGERSCATSG
jgi:hypothetical protein